MLAIPKFAKLVFEGLFLGPPENKKENGGPGGH
jgi:hypothetical protein